MRSNDDSMSVLAVCYIRYAHIIHSDRSRSFMSRELHSFLYENGVATSGKTLYNRHGKGQLKRLKRTLWCTIQLASKSKTLPIDRYKELLLDVLYSTSSLLCEPTNETPHECLFPYHLRSTFSTTLSV
ncbi:uncharacterized protein DEA37_0006426 [Paragonimus westermani]|uniref:Integrase catalytic domain-containing protein n=1 Tax=Paragonimus westermani TaxID=34504 RepID=A0A5J4NCE1_9TREM|nr:uncharacterized protein DEA37_0006426 [Paragonimus westermani]